MNPRIEDDDNVNPMSVHRADRAGPGPEVLLDEAEPGEFARLVTSSPEVMGRFIRERAVDNVVRAARPWGNRTLEECVALGRAAVERENASRVVQLPADTNASEPPARDLGWLRWAAAAAILAVAVLLLITTGQSGKSVDTSQHYAASADTAKTVVLPDGTVVTLSPATTLDRDFTAQQRSVRLPAGEAEFKVAHDESRPFLVHTPFDGIARAVGTVFKVSIHDPQVAVQVSEGKVSVSRAGSGDTRPLIVVAGQTAILRASGDIEMSGARAETGTPDPAVAKRTPVPFTRERLGKVALIFNERSGRRVFEVRGSACEFRISSVLDPARPDELLRDVHDEPGLEVMEEGEVNVIRARGDASDAPCGNEGR
ncbi:MAG: FecR domain-containing protein [Gammaproteobacteria bacterium]